MSRFKSAATYQIIVPNEGSGGGSTTVDIDPSSLPYASHVSLDGTGSPNIVRRTQSYANAHGAVDRGYHIDAREMAWNLYLFPPYGSDEGDLQAARMYLAEMLKPSRTPYKLKVTRADSAVRQIDFHISGAVDFPQSRQIGLAQPVTIPIYCPNPAWYDPTQKSVALAMSGSEETESAGYLGNSIDYPIIEFGADLVSPYVYINRYDSETYTCKVDLFGYTVPTGDKAIIDIAARTAVLETAGTDIRDEIFNDDWIIGYMGPRYYAESAASTTPVVAGNYAGSGTITVRWYDRYHNL